MRWPTAFFSFKICFTVLYHRTISIKSQWVVIAFTHCCALDSHVILQYRHPSTRCLSQTLNSGSWRENKGSSVEFSVRTDGGRRACVGRSVRGGWLLSSRRCWGVRYQPLTPRVRACSDTRTLIREREGGRKMRLGEIEGKREECRENKK